MPLFGAGGIDRSGVKQIDHDQTEGDATDQTPKVAVGEDGMIRDINSNILITLSKNPFIFFYSLFFL